MPQRAQRQRLSLEPFLLSSVKVQDNHLKLRILNFFEEINKFFLLVSSVKRNEGISIDLRSSLPLEMQEIKEIQKWPWIEFNVALGTGKFVKWWKYFKFRNSSVTHICCWFGIGGGDCWSSGFRCLVLAHFAWYISDIKEFSWRDYWRYENCTTTFFEADTETAYFAAQKWKTHICLYFGVCRFSLIKRDQDLVMARWLFGRYLWDWTRNNKSLLNMFGQWLFVTVKIYSNCWWSH